MANRPIGSATARGDLQLMVPNDSSIHILQQSPAEQHEL
ncbi:hypothetical protein Vi05172_g1122 [Venturia inaequalis]|nr:hypothetical protein Vi05172_g1122 [Venturia inaequalis]